ncbi:MAG: zinc ribbon domain-containing protein [Oscillospiraceae bacterium]
MKFCTNCNHVLKDDETTCPYCTHTISEPVSDAVISPSDIDAADTIDIVDQVNYATATLELPMGYLDENAMIVSDTIDTAAREDYDFPPEPAFDDDEEPSFDYVPDEEPTEPEGDLELEANTAIIDDGNDDDTNILGKLGVSLIAILVAAVFIFAVSCLVKYMKGPAASDQQIMLDYVSGTWMSEPFVFASDTSHSYVELFTINKDGTFALKHLIPNIKDEKGYEDGSWDIDYQISGTVEIMLDSQCIIMKYTEFGKDYYFDRYIIKTEDNALTLREFYDEAATQSFDIVYSRISDSSPRRQPSDADTAAPPLEQKSAA